MTEPSKSFLFLNLTSVVALAMGVGACAAAGEGDAVPGASSAGGGTAAPGECEPSGEACDGLDNDCDGEVDEDCSCSLGDTQSCFTASSALEGIGVCKAGEQSCNASGTWGACEGEVVPSDESCDGLDNDCDGVADEDLGTVTCGLGACQVAVDACQNGSSVPCLPPDPGTETCDGTDDDCDGIVDEDCSCLDGDQQSCYTGAPQTQGVGACQAGSQSCSGGAWGACLGDVTPTSETCDGVDEDCDGQVDEGDPGGGASCNTGQLGQCHIGTLHCHNGAVTCLPDNQPVAELCDSLDNDCDGNVDEGNPQGGQGCSTGQVGVCAAGVTTCQGGSLVCEAGATPSPEVCDGLDNDCDGATDEGNPGGGGSCTTALPGICASGVSACVGGSLICNPQQSATQEVCEDSLDNDCDGQVDENCGTCNNIAPTATAAVSSGSTGVTYGPHRMNNLVGEACTEWAWVNNSPGVATGQWASLTWTSPQTIGSFYVDGNHATNPACSYTGRDIKHAAVQYYNGSSWVTAGTLQNQEDYLFTFPQPITTTALRLYDIYSSPPNGDTIIYEWYVYPSVSCTGP